MYKSKLKTQNTFLSHNLGQEEAPDMQIILIEQNEQVIGFTLVKVLTDSEFGEADIAEISLLHIEPAYQNKATRKIVYAATFKALYKLGFNEVYCSPALSKKLKKFGYSH